MKGYNMSVRLMMAALAVLCFSACNNWAPKEETGWEKYGLKGDVASLRTVPYVVESFENNHMTVSVEASMENLYLEFDTQGRTLKSIRYNTSLEPLTYTENRYNGDGQLLESTVVDTAGRRLEWITCRYSSGRLCEMSTTDAGDTLKSFEEYNYFGQDSVKVLFYLGGKTEPSGYRMINYDDHGRQTSMITYSKDGKNKVNEFYISYDSLGRRQKISSHSIFFGQMDTDVSYDENGLSSQVIISGQRRATMTLRFVYKLDSHGNWVERVTYQDDSPVPTRVVKREIRYFRELR